MKNSNYLLSFVLLLIGFLSIGLFYHIISVEEEGIKIILYLLFVLPFFIIVTILCWYGAVKILINENNTNIVDMKVSEQKLKKINKKGNQNILKTSIYGKIWLGIRFVLHIIIGLSLIVYCVDAFIEYGLFLKEYNYSFFDVFGLGIMLWYWLIGGIGLGSIVIGWGFIKKLHNR